MIGSVEVMIWIAIVGGFRSSLVFSQSKLISQRYTQNLYNRKLYRILEFFQIFIFQQVEARPHIVRTMLGYFQCAEVSLLLEPPGSADLSTIEHL